VRLYRSLLVLYPSEFRDEYGRELCLALADRCRAQTSRLGVLLVWIHAVFGVLAEAPQEHYHVMLQDIRHALRVMWKDAPVTAAAIAILALGIGSTTTVFSLVNGILVRPLPYPEPERLVAVAEFQRATSSVFGDSVAFPNYQDIRARTRLLQDIGLYAETHATIRGEGDAEQIPAAKVTDGLFPVLGVKPILGTVLSREQDVPNGPPVVVIGQDLWQRRYGGDPAILGKTLEILNTRRTVIGVMPSSFRFPERAEIWLPLQLDPKDPTGGATRTDHWLQAVARLRPGASVEQASDELESLMRQINEENPKTSYGNHAHAISFRNYIAGDYRQAVITLLCAVGFLLLIACANITNLLLAKASVRTREMALRAALGASRTRLIRQLITESILLGLTGAVAGIFLSLAGVRLLLALIPIDLPTWMTFSTDWRVLGFALAVSLLTSLIFGVVPAFGASRVDLTGSLKEGGRAGTASAGRQYLRNGLVVAEVALSLTLLAGAGLMVRSFLALRTQSLGFNADKVLTLDFGTPANRYPDGPKARALLGRMEHEIQSLPGVSSMAFSSFAPLASNWGRSLTVEGSPLLPLKDAPMINHTVVTPGYFRALEIPMLEGRDFTGSDWDHPLVTIVDQSLAKRYWPNQSAIGKRVRFGPPENNEPWHTVIGVSGDVLNQQLKRAGRWNIYIPASADYSVSSIILRTAQDPVSLAKAIRARIHAIDPDIAVSEILSLNQIVNRSAWRERFVAVLFSVFSVLALILAAVGLYGVLAYTVSLRTHEIGIRMALGASARAVQGMVLRQGLALAALGLVSGTLAALALTRLLATQLYHVTPTDPKTFMTVLALLITVSAISAFIPARRATGVEPLIALREE
jgi:putative ABC transport system permease protein